ncbi:hypothetical protein [Sansalvadorimonas verongulae]|uniref:hypothetical protein n=1 Tax=Sansalvadorimonas verongulae TaxID=2172824 RepID=UPI0012BD2ED9|nr:hypothetical protein [Sansalvadorimonas verongulae]MTI11843.1 hypothetical protein [Sansalvadorimonas verongulae]
MDVEQFAYIAVMLFSSVAIIILLNVAGKLGGSVGQMVKGISFGIFMSVFCYSAFHIGGYLGLVDEEVLFPIMAVLLAFGSLAFVLSAYNGLNNIES